MKCHQSEVDVSASSLWNRFAWKLPHSIIWLLTKLESPLKKKKTSQWKPTLCCNVTHTHAHTLALFARRLPPAGHHEHSGGICSFRLVSPEAFMDSVEKPTFKCSPLIFLRLSRAKPQINAFFFFFWYYSARLRRVGVRTPGGTVDSPKPLTAKPARQVNHTAMPPLPHTHTHTDPKVRSLFSGTCSYINSPPRWISLKLPVHV